MSRFVLSYVSVRKFTCNLPDCGLEAEFVCSVGEEALVPAGGALTRKPLDGPQRSFIVRCPVHGLRWILEIGHHISRGMSAEAEPPLVPCRYKCGWALPLLALDPSVLEAHEQSCRVNPSNRE